MRARPIPFGVWLLSLATLLQLSAALWASMHSGDRRGGVMLVSGLILLTITVVLFIKRPQRAEPDSLE